MPRNRISEVRRFAVALVLGNLALVGLLASVLPQAALVLLPLVAFTVPLLSAAAVEEALKAKPSDHRNSKPARVTAAPRFNSAFHQAA
jgi:hypothetical protein